MNEKIILAMVEPYVKDSAITYDEFDQIFSILSRREQYAVTDILYKNGIDLVDAHVKEEALVLDVDIEDDSEEEFEGDSYEVLYDETLFKDNSVRKSEIESLFVYDKILQSNEILCSLIQQGNRQAAQDLCIIAILKINNNRHNGTRQHSQRQKHKQQPFGLRVPKHPGCEFAVFSK